jgi:hypothetical protein
MKACGSLYANSNVKIIGGKVAIEGEKTFRLKLKPF